MNKEWFNYSEFYDFIVKNFKFTTFVELGTWKGHSITYLAKITNNKSKIFAVDIWDDWKSDYNIFNGGLYSIYNKYLIDNNVRSKIVDIKSISWEASKNFDDESVDFIFIDADHSYQSVINDIESWLPKMKKNSIISGHDYFKSAGVKKAVDLKFGDKTIFFKKIWYVQL